MNKERTLENAIQTFKENIKQEDYVKLGAKGEYLTVPYRIKFVREYFGARLQIITYSFELANGSHKFRAGILLDGKETVIYTDFDGNFTIENVMAGEHTISFSLITYNNKQVTFNASKENSLQVELETK